MDASLVLRVEGLGKKFSRVPATARVPGLRRLLRTMAGFADSPEPVQLGQEEFWALQNIQFSLRRGETLGIVGLNGAGKSTLLKIILDRLRPDVGHVHVEGRPGGLIELAAGFHPEMTGRENISLNAALLGASADDIERLTPAIIAFADIGAFIDSPVKIYSSGMKVRLGFAIAIHTLSGLLVFDEILSVGDFEFRQKCLHKINSLRAERTFLLVSHNLRDISLFCDRALLLHKGEQILLGGTQEVLTAYSHCNRRFTAAEVRAKIQDPASAAPPPATSPAPVTRWNFLKRLGPRPAAADSSHPETSDDLSDELKTYLFGEEYTAAEKICDVSFRWNLPHNPSGFYYLSGTPWEAELAFTLLAPCPHLRIALPFFNREGELILSPDSKDFIPATGLPPGPHRFRLALNPLPVNHGTFWIYLSITDDPAHLFRKYLANFTVHNPSQAFGLVQTSPVWAQIPSDASNSIKLTTLI